MADRPAARPRPVAAVPERDDTLSALNDHLGRFLAHADDLLADWSRFSADVRARVDADVARLGDTVADAIDESVDRAAARVQDEVGSRLVARLGAVTDDLDRVNLAARRAAAAAGALQLDRRRSAGLALAALVAAIVANLLLAIVLYVLLSRPSPPPAPPAAAPAAVPIPDAATPAVRGTSVQLDADVPPPAKATPKRGGTKSPPKRRGH